jgi:hypothetical protein
MGSGSAAIRSGRTVAGPWHRGEQLRLAFLTLLSSGGLALSWWMVAGTADGSSQLAWIEAGIVALLLGAVAEAVWLSVGHRAVSRRRRVVCAGLAELARALETRRLDSVPADGRVCAGARMTRHHRGDCPLVQGKAVVWSSVEDSLRAGRRPCGVCTP